ncbi:MAG TPA: HAMP domain-containing sensor histidine kinase, partial [Bdellovibrionota bacterium]|nr:HAMP domain-containing sensor histidine kinase [Bdellovibrionota bacterium]
GPERGTELGEVVESLENSNQELKRYIESVLSLSKIESQKVILNRKSNDINRVIERALRRLQPLAKPKGIALETDLEPLFSVECDEDLMGQVVSNLIDNAIKHSPTGSRVIVRSREEDGQIRVDVEDFGSGIPKDKLPLVFRKFSRFLRPIHEPVRGTGLGLYLSKYFIELHGGSIRLKTEEGRGTTFTFTLPITPSPGFAAAPGLVVAHHRAATPQLDSSQPVR